MQFEERFHPGDNVLAMLKEAQYAVEASNHEQFIFYVLYSKDSGTPYHTKVNYKQRGGGYMSQIGILDKRPITLSLFVNEINGIPVLFYEGCSQLVDHLMIENWLKAFCPAYAARRECDMGNIHQCIHYIDDIQKAFLESLKK